MSETHDRVQQLVQMSFGGRLSGLETAEMEGHLAECEACRSYRAGMQELDSALRKALHARRDRVRMPERNIAERTVKKMRVDGLLNKSWNIAQYSLVLAAVLLLVTMASRLVPGIPYEQTVPPSAGDRILQGLPAVLANLQRITPANAAGLTQLKAIGIKDPPERIVHFSFSPTSDKIALARSDGYIQIWNIRERSLLQWNVLEWKDAQESPYAKEELRSLAFSPDGKTIATGLMRYLNGPDGNLYAIDRGGSSSLQIWDITGAETPVLRESLPVTASVVGIVFRPDGKQLAYVTLDETEDAIPLEWGKKTGVLSVRFWDLRTGSERIAFSLQPVPAPDSIAVSFSPDGNTLAFVDGSSGAENGNRTTLYDLTTGEQKYRLNSVSFDPVFDLSGNLLATSAGSSLQVWDLTTGKLRFEQWTGYTGMILAFSPDSAMLTNADGAGGYRVQFWDTTTGSLIWEWIVFADLVAFSPDGTTLATVTRNGTICIWDFDESKVRGR